MADQAATPGAQRGTNRHLTLASCRTHQKKVGDVHAYKSQNQRGQSHEQRRQFGKGIPSAQDPWRPQPVGAQFSKSLISSIFLQQSLAYDREFGLDLLDLHTGLHPRQGNHAASVGLREEVGANSSLDRVHTQRKVSLDLEKGSGPEKTLGRNSNDGHGVTVNKNGFPQD